MLACALAAAGCGQDSSSETTIEAATLADEELAAVIADELAVYEQGFDLELLPPDQQAQIGAVVDNLPQAAGGVRVLRVSDGIVEAETDFPDDEQGAETSGLICGAIERSVGADDPGGHRVLGADDAVLAECEPEDASFP